MLQGVQFGRAGARQGRGKPRPYYTQMGRLPRPCIVGAIPCGRPVDGHYRVALAFANKGLYGRPGSLFTSKIRDASYLFLHHILHLELPPLLLAPFPMEQAAVL